MAPLGAPPATGIRGFLAERRDAAQRPPATLDAAPAAALGATLGSATAVAMQGGALGSAAALLAPAPSSPLIKRVLGLSMDVSFKGVATALFSSALPVAMRGGAAQGVSAAAASGGPQRLTTSSFFSGAAAAGSFPPPTVLGGATRGATLGGSMPVAAVAAAPSSTAGAAPAGAAPPTLPALLGGGALAGGAQPAPSSPTRFGAARALPCLPPALVPQPHEFDGLVASGADILSRLASGAVVVHPGAEGGDVAFAPLTFARGAAPTLCTSLLHAPSGARVGAADFVATLLPSAVDVVAAAEHLREMVPLLPLCAIGFGAQRQGVVLVPTRSGALVLRTPISVTKRVLALRDPNVSSVVRRTRTALFESSDALGGAFVVRFGGVDVTAHFVQKLVVRDNNLLNLRALLSHGGAVFGAPPPVRRAGASTVATVAVVAPAGGEAAVEEPEAAQALPQLRGDIVVKCPNAMGITGEELGGLRAGGEGVVQGAALQLGGPAADTLAGAVEQNIETVEDGGNVTFGDGAAPSPSVPVPVAAPPPAPDSEKIAAAMLREALAAAPSLAGAGGAGGDHAVRAAHPQEIILESLKLPPRLLNCPPLAPLDVFDRGFAKVASAVSANSASAPPPLSITPGRGGSVQNVFGDVDGLFAAGSAPPGGLLSRWSVARQRLLPFVDTRPALSPLAFLFRGRLREVISREAALLATSIFADTEPATVASPAALLRGRDARPHHLALAYAADLLSRPPPPDAARAAVEVVFSAAASVGYEGGAHLVQVPVNGYAPICLDTFTADPSLTRGARQPLLRLPSCTGASGEPLTVCVFGWAPGDVARATREVLCAIGARNNHGSTGSATWALWHATAATGESRKLPGGACVTLSVLVHLLTSFPTTGSGPCFWVKTYNQKARGAELPLPNDLRVDAAAVGATLGKALVDNNSAVPLLYNLLAGGPEAVRICVGAGVAANSVLDHGLKRAYGSVRLNVHSGDPERLLRVGADGENPHGGGFNVRSYPAFGVPPSLGPCTASRPFSRLDKPAAGDPALVSAEAYSRAFNCAPDASYKKAGDLAGATTINISGEPILGLRIVEGATKAAAIHASIFLTQFASTGALPRVDAVWVVDSSLPLADALGSALKSTAGLFRRGLVTAPLEGVASFMASGVTSLFAAHYAALRALSDTGLAPLDMLSVSSFLGTTAALLRYLASGRFAGRGALPPKVCLSLDINQLNGLPPLPPCVSAILGCAPSVEAPFEPLAEGGAGILGAAAAHANDMGARLAATSKPFSCASPGCSFLCPTVNALHAHLREAGHQAPPTGPGGSYVKTPAINRTIVEKALRGLTPTQRVVVTAAVATGRSIVLGGPGGVGKTVVTRALVAALQVLYPDGVLWLTPTGIARLVAGPLAQTLNSALGIGRPADTDTVETLVAAAKANAARLLPLLRSVKLLVVDEAHRVGEREILVLQELLRWAKESTLPFAGVQCVLSGDAGQTLNFTDNKLHATVKAGLSGKSTWLMSATGTSLLPLYFELSEIMRTASREFISAQIALRWGEQWAPGNSAYDYLLKNCAPTHPRNEGLVRQMGNQWVPTLAAVERGYTALYAKNDQARFAEKCVLEEARAQGGAAFRVLELRATDGLHSSTKGRYKLEKADEKHHDGGAPPSIRIYPGAMVSVTNPTPVTALDNTPWVVPSSMKGRVEAFEGDCMENAAVTVHFPATRFSKETRHVFKAAWVDSANVPSDGTPVSTRLALQLRPGGCMTMHLAQGVTLDKGILVLQHVHGDWAAGLLVSSLPLVPHFLARASLLALLAHAAHPPPPHPAPHPTQYTAVGRFSDPDALCVCFSQGAVNRANKAELEFFAARAAETAKELVGHSLQQLTVVRNVTGFLASHFAARGGARPGRVAAHGHSDLGLDAEEM